MKQSEKCSSNFDVELLEKLTSLAGIAGHEHEVSDFLIAHLHEYVWRKDNLGSVVFKTGTGPKKVMLAAHMDEVGFIVKEMSEDGYLFFQPLGGWSPHVLVAKEVVITTHTGQKVLGIIQCQQNFLGNKADFNVQMDDLYVDVGVASQLELEKLGIEIGDMITPKNNFAQLANPEMFVGKAFDDRVGCYILIKVLEQLKDCPEVTLYGTATTQEEVGLRGAKTASQMVKPDYGIVIDTGLTTDRPFDNKKLAKCKLGDGPAINLYNKALIADNQLVQHFKQIAESENLSYQQEILAHGGTDGGEIQRVDAGVATLTISIPTRYIHTHNLIVNKCDIENAIELIVKAIKELG